MLTEPLEVQPVIWFFRLDVVITILLGVALTVILIIFNLFLTGWFFLRMPRLSNLMRLGISRGWRFRVLNSKIVYSASLVHCMLLYLLIRAKSLKLGLWVVLYNIFGSRKRYVIHIFFWTLPGRIKKRILNPLCVVRFKKIRRFKRRPKSKIYIQSTLIKLTLKPTHYRLGLFWKYRLDRDSSTKAAAVMTNRWVTGRFLLRTWFRLFKQRYSSLIY